MAPIALAVVVVLAAWPGATTTAISEDGTKRKPHSKGFGSPVQGPTIEDRKGEEEQRRLERYRRAIEPPGLDVLTAIGECESGGDPTIIDSSGTYFGKFQFNLSAWHLVGGQGLPSDAPEKEQDVRAARLYRKMGPSPWPVCAY